MKAMAEPGAKPYGRRAFLALLAGGATSFLWAGSASNVLSPVTSAFSQLLGNLFPVGGWRIYTISGSMPVFDPSSYRARGQRPRPQAAHASPTRSCSRCPRAHQVSTFHCVTGWTVRNVHWSGVRFSHLLDLVEPLPAAKAIRFDSLEVPYNDSLTLRAGAPARRDARAGDGREAALAARTGRPRAW